MSTCVSAQFAGIPESVGATRQLVRRALGKEHPAADAAAVCAAELATNALLHSRSGRPGGVFTVLVQADAAGVLVQIRDQGAWGLPLLADQVPGAEHGYGLRIVAAFSAAWGTEACGAGRATWCRLASSGLLPAGMR